ncbi:MAG: hypothetical protein AAF663_03965, partial [Planctomycetota bacterium]
LVLLLAFVAVGLSVRLVIAQQAVSTQVSLQASQPPPAASVRYGQTKLLPSEQRFVASQSGMLPSQMRDLRVQSGALPSQGRIAPPPGNASVRYSGYTEQYNRVANNTAASSVRYGGNLNASRTYGNAPQVHTVTPVPEPEFVQETPAQFRRGQVASTQITNYQPWTPRPDQSRPVSSTPASQPSVRYNPASLGQFTPSATR